MLRLILTTPHGVQRIDLDPRRSEWVVGRSDASDIVVDDELASKRHFRIERAGRSSLRIVDLGSRNGVRLNGELSPRIQIQPGDRIAFGRTSAELVRIDSASGPVPLAPSNSKPSRAGRLLPVLLAGSIFVIGGVTIVWAITRLGQGDGSETETAASPVDPPLPGAVSLEEVSSGEVSSEVASREPDRSQSVEDSVPRSGRSRSTDTVSRGATNRDASGVRAAERAGATESSTSIRDTPTLANFDREAFAGCSASLCHATSDVDFRGDPLSHPGRWLRNADLLALRAEENALPAFRRVKPHDARIEIDLSAARPPSPGPFSQAVPAGLPDADTVRLRFTEFRRAWRRAPSASELARETVASPPAGPAPVISPAVSTWRDLWTVTFGRTPSPEDLALLSKIDDVLPTRARERRDVVRTIAHSPFRVAPRPGEVEEWARYVARTASLLDWNGPGIQRVAEFIEDGSVDPAWFVEALFAPEFTAVAPPEVRPQLRPDSDRPVRVDVVSRQDFRADFASGDGLGLLWDLIPQSRVTIFDGRGASRSSGETLLESLARPVEDETRWVDRARPSFRALLDGGVGVEVGIPTTSIPLRALVDRVGDPRVERLSGGNRAWLLSQIGRSETELEAAPVRDRQSGGRVDVLAALAAAIEDADGPIGAIVVVPAGDADRTMLMNRLAVITTNPKRAFEFWFWGAAHEGGRTAVRVSRPAGEPTRELVGWIERRSDVDALEFHPTAFGRRLEADSSTSSSNSELEAGSGSDAEPSRPSEDGR